MRLEREGLGQGKQAWRGIQGISSVGKQDDETWNWRQGPESELEEL
jgi:hypothetical protein